MPIERLQGFRWQSPVDFLILFLAVYLLLLWGKQARALRIALAIVGLRAGSLLARQFDLIFTPWVMDAASFVAIGLLLFVFQSELRYAVVQIEATLRHFLRQKISLVPAFAAISEAAFALATTNRGALIVVSRQDPIEELIQGGIALGGEISKEILEAIFRKVSPVHDGAAIIQGNRIVTVSAILPLTQRTDLPSGYGTRHRAALGLAERCDAIVVVVSEGRRVVALVSERQFQQMATAEELGQRLQNLCGAATAIGPTPMAKRLRKNLGLKATAAALALLIWGISFGIKGTTSRTIGVPVEFTNIGENMKISYQSATVLQVQLRGSAWLLDSVNLTRVVAYFDLNDSVEGKQTIPVSHAALNLPPGVEVERVSPGSVSIYLLRELRPLGDSKK